LKLKGVTVREKLRSLPVRAGHWWNFRLRNRKILMVVGHMRSGSSLLGHLLAENPEICAYGETHRKYKKPRDFESLRRDLVSVRNGVSRSSVWFCDKVLHDYLPDLELLRSDYVYVLFLARAPGDTLPSIVKIWNDPGLKMEQASDYYLRRLEFCRTLADQLDRRRSFFLEYDDLIQNGEAVLSRLSAFLSLDRPLKTNYSILPTTGVPGFGDPSQNIYAGRIVDRESGRRPAGEARQDPSMVARYDEYRHHMRQRCSS
jgi:hypothetical protein